MAIRGYFQKIRSVQKVIVESANACREKIYVSYFYRSV